MRVIIQRVTQASVSVENEMVGEIGQGLLVFAGFEDEDQITDIDWMIQKIIKLRIFPDEQGVMNCSVVDHQGQILAVSQFTLFASTKKGNRPSWGRAARGEISQPLFNLFVDRLSHALGRPIQSGIFGAEMQVNLTNDGPITISIDSKSPE